MVVRSAQSFKNNRLASLRFKSRPAAIPLSLKVGLADRRRAAGTKDACLRPKPGAAFLALMEELPSVDRHSLQPAVAAVRTGDLKAKFRLYFGRRSADRRTAIWAEIQFVDEDGMAESGLRAMISSPNRHYLVVIFLPCSALPQLTRKPNARHETLAGVFAFQSTT
jgi:hypothetical protein